MYEERGTQIFDEWLAAKVRYWAEQGKEFDASELNPVFIPYMYTGQRIKVRFWDSDDHIKTGTVAATTGWRPSLMLMLRSSDHGSSWPLGREAELLAVQIDGKYVEVTSVV